MYTKIKAIDIIEDMKRKFIEFDVIEDIIRNG